jgi:biopolymer transport protein ExbB
MRLSLFLTCPKMKGCVKKKIKPLKPLSILNFRFSFCRTCDIILKIWICGEKSVIDMIVKGGIVMYPIILCSIVGFAIFIERLWVLRRKNIIPPEFIHNVEELLKKRKLSDAVFLSQGDSSSIAKIFFSGLKNADKGIHFVRESIEDQGSREAAGLERGLGVLATVANVGTLLGLLGTVSGIIKTFNVVALVGLGNPAPLATGIAEALVATGGGLCVAIPALVAHRILKDKAENLILVMEERTARFLEIMADYAKRD